MLDAVSNSSRTSGYIFGYGDVVQPADPFAGLSDQFSPSNGSGSSLFTPMRPFVRPADQAADAALLCQGGSGCSCGNCSTVSGTGNPLDSLKARDAEVREHEGQHLSAAGEFACGGPEFTFVTAHNGQQFAIGGKVHVDVSKIANDPQRTKAKMQKLRRSALAPASPSDQDRRVAAQASMQEMEADQELARKSQGPAQGQRLH